MSLQVSVLESTEDCKRTILVATVHMYFHPRAPHVRILQTAVCLRHLERVLENCSKQVCSEEFNPLLIVPASAYHRVCIVTADVCKYCQIRICCNVLYFMYEINDYLRTSSACYSSRAPTTSMHENKWYENLSMSFITGNLNISLARRISPAR